jgi:type I restriction enzyme S subunit
VTSLAKRIELGKLCSVVTKGTTPTSLGMSFENEGIPFLRIQNLHGSSVHLKNILFISKSTHDSLNRSKIKSGDFLITIAGTIGRVAIVPADFPEANCNQAIAILRFEKSKLLPKYLLHWLTTADAMGQISGKKVTATISNLSLSQIKELQIPLPPLTEQKRIAAILDKADAIRRKRQQAIQLADDFLRAVFLDMFGDPVTNPKGWTSTSLLSHGAFKNGLNYGKEDSGTSIRCLGVGDFKAFTSIGDVSSLSTVELNRLPADDYFLEDGDLVFVRSNGNKALVGRSVTVYPQNEKITFSGFCIRYRVANNSIEPEYLNFMFRTPSMKQAMLSGGQGANIQNINQKRLSEIDIPIPPMNLQMKFARVVEAFKNSQHQNKNSSSKIDHLFGSLSQKAFSGQL